MVGKILLLVVLLGAAILLFRLRLRRSRQRGGSSSGESGPGHLRVVRVLAYGLVALGLVSGALYAYLDWQSQGEVIAVRVVNIYTGEGVRYQARRGDVGWRRFTTLDGRRITLADVERLEVEEPR